MEEQSNHPKAGGFEISIKQLHAANRGLRIALFGLIVAILSLITMVIFGILGLQKSVGDIQSGVNEVSSRVERVEKGILARQFTITTPVDGASVDRIAVIRGKTPFTEMNHYVVVTPVKTGDDWVQDGPVQVSASGLWTGRAIFGAAAVGAREEFMVRALATKSTLSPGPLIEVPEDAIFSESITVTRTR